MRIFTARRLLWIALAALGFATPVGITTASLPYLLRGPALTSGATPGSSGSARLPAQLPCTPSAQPAAAPGELTVITLNTAHGRGDGANQIFQSRAAIRSHLDDIARLLARQRPDVVALQEADGPSAWSGKFDHVAYLARAADFPYFYRGEHVSGLELSYGTALLSRLPTDRTMSVTFQPSPPTWTKGFVVADVPWPARPDVKLTVVSVHLDFARASVRRSQAERLARVLARRPRPMIVMGDFNCDWSAAEDGLRVAADRLGLRPYDPRARQVTFPKTGRRLDWILISDALEFADYRVLPEPVSDHRGVVAGLRLVETSPAVSARASEVPATGDNSRRAPQRGFLGGGHHSGKG